MSAASILSAADTLLTGNPKKAKLTINTVSSSTAAGSAGALASQLVSQTAQALTQGSVSAAGGTGGLSKTLTVHYNPSSIQLQANADAVDVSYLLKNVDNGVPRQQTRPPSITMSVELVFDDMNVKDAFMAEKFKLLSMSESISGLASSGAALYRTATGQNYSVQAQTNGIVALLMSKNTRQVTFSWANLSFSGEVNQVQARYTMFSTSGRPVRSVVTLILVQEFSNQTDRDKWNTAFDTGFKASLSEAGCLGFPLCARPNNGFRILCPTVGFWAMDCWTKFPILPR